MLSTLNCLSVQILVKMMDHAIDEMDMLRSANEQKIFDIQRINGQLNKALEVRATSSNGSCHIAILCFIQTVKQTVDMKEKLEADLYRKVNESYLFFTETSAGQRLTTLLR